MPLFDTQMQDKIASVLVRSARECIGSRFRLQGRDPQWGLDCVGLVIWSAQQAGVILQDQFDYSLHDDPQRLDNALNQTLLENIVFIEDDVRLHAGDIVRFVAGGTSMHLGIVTPKTLIHADARLRRIVEHRLDADWSSRIVSIHRLRSV